MRVALRDGRILSGLLGRDAFEPTSQIASSTFIPVSFQLVLQTTRQDQIVLDVPRPLDQSPLGGRPTIYLDQNHWSTLTNTIHEPGRVRSAEERAAARRSLTLPDVRKSSYHSHRRTSRRRASRRIHRIATGEA